MPLVCRHCQRANPDEALYCHRDGIALDNRGQVSGPIAVGARPFRDPFVFPSGQACSNFDQLVLACESLWKEAQELLQQGYLEGFLGGLGRADLARAARQAAQSPDPDRGLDDFLIKLPASSREPPRLAVQPLEINLGQLSRQDDQHLTLELLNQGMGLLTGSASSADTDWLSLGDGAHGKLFQFRHDHRLSLTVVGKCLRAGAKPLEGRLVLETNGGTATVLVRAEVPIRPFPDGVLAGARSPRQIAEKAKGSPKEAAALFEKGAVAAWYTDNGWTYPVQGPPASGIGAVQQFFEALGLVTPPKVEISTQNILLYGDPFASLEEEIVVQAAEKRPVYAHASSSALWLQIGKVSLKGQVARIPLRIPSVPDLPGERLQARVHVGANGNQRFTVDVYLTVSGEPSGRRTGSIDRRPSLEVAESGSVPPVRRLPPGGSPAIPVLGLADLADAPALSPAAVPLLPSLADLYGTSAPVARVIPLPDEPEPTRNMPPSRPVEAVEEAELVTPGRPTAVAELGTPASGDWTPGPRPAPAEEAEEDEPVPRRRPFWLHLLPAVVLVLCLLVTIGRDLVKWAQAAPGSTEPGGTQAWTDPRPRIGLRFHDHDLNVGLGSGGIKPQEQGARETSPAVWEPSMRFGVVMLNTTDPRDPRRMKRLNYEEEGTTNNVCVRLDGNEWLFGDRPFRRLDGKPTGDWPGRWLPGQRDVHLPDTPGSVDGRRSTWVYEQQGVEITQTVEIVRGPQSGLLDTCLVRYRLENKGGERHRVGLRFLLDTYIGSNDGVPFLIPGEKRLISDRRDLGATEQIPDFIQACENEDLSHPGTIAQVGLRLGGVLEPPGRVTLGAWPNPALLEIDKRCLQEKTLWEVPVLDIHALPDKPDSAVTIYWEQKDLFPGQDRQVGFTYGLGNVSAGEGAGQLALTVGGSFMPRGEFTVTAYVSNPVPGQKVTLLLPDGFELINGTAEQSVPPLPADGSSRNSPVTWKVRGPRQEGRYTLKVTSSTGVTQTTPVKIQVKGIFGD